ncbi:hypothetical protein GCM10009127_07950 [Alteraurantiacibacter aestuarii]
MQALQADRLADAAAALEDLRRLEPGEGRWPRMLVMVLTEMNRHGDAAQLCRALIARDGADPVLHLILGDLERAIGNSDAARHAYRGALDIHPGQGRAWWSLAFYHGEQVETEVRAAFGRPGASPLDQALLHFALGEAAHAQAEHEVAFGHFGTGNDMLARIEPFDPRGFGQEIAALLSDMPQLDESEASADRPAPIFLVGMPRSGSTLLERMLGAHSQVEALGESRSMARLAGLHMQRGGAESAVMSALGSDYLSLSAARRHGAEPFFIDKMHLNWRFVPVILKAMPAARIIDLRRGAMDCCWSNYRFPFQGGHPSSCDQRNIASFYRGYARVMDEANTRAPGRVLRLDYEDLVADADFCLRAICDWIGISFEPSMLDLGKASGPTGTASSEQVRRPLNRKGIGVHEPYREWLEPMAAALRG